MVIFSLSVYIYIYGLVYSPYGVTSCSSSIYRFPYLFPFLHILPSESTRKRNTHYQKATKTSS